jgi:hypothetical protein
MELRIIIQYVLHLRIKNYEITSTKTYSLNVFKQYKKVHRFPFFFFFF